MAGCAVIQYKPPKGMPEQALDELSLLIEEAGEKGASLIVCPEMASTGYLWPDVASIVPYAELPSGRTFQRLSPLAKRYQCWIICGYVELSEEKSSSIDPRYPAVYNSALMISPQGAMVHSYRKVLLYEADKLWAESGNQRVLVESEYGVLFPAICMDLNDPFLPQQLIEHRPEIFPFCTNWLDEETEVLSYWRGRLQGWNGWFLAANTWGDEQYTDPVDGIKKISFRGESVILGPDKELLAQAPKSGNHVLFSSWS